MTDNPRRQFLVGAGMAGGAAIAGTVSAQTPIAKTLKPESYREAVLRPDDWDADTAPGLSFLFEARVKLYLPPLTVGSTPEGNRIIYVVKDGTFEGPHLKGRVVPNSGADWVRIRSDGTGVLDVRFCLETHDNALLYVYWQGRFWTNAEHAEYALDLTKPDDPDGAWRYYFRTAPLFETGDPRYAWLNNVVAVSKSRTGDGGPIHRVFAVT